MTYAVRIGILDGLSHAIRSGMNFLALEWVGMQCETVTMLVEASKLSEQVPGQLPKLLVESIQDVAAVNSDFFHDLLIKVVEKLFTGVALPGSYLGFQFVLELVEFELK